MYFIFSKLLDWSLTIRCSLMSYLNTFKVLLPNTNISINHLFAHSLNGFKYYHLSTIDHQPLPPSTFKIKRVVCMPQEQFEEYVQANHIRARARYDQGLSNCTSSPVKIKVKCCRLCDYFGYQVKDCSANRILPTTGKLIEDNLTPLQKCSIQLQPTGQRYSQFKKKKKVSVFNSDNFIFNRWPPYIHCLISISLTVNLSKLKNLISWKPESTMLTLQDFFKK